DEALAVDRTDGLSMSFPDWRFNLRSSNTEPVVRLNVESKGKQEIMKKMSCIIIDIMKKEKEE
ncbi:phosphomannomutase CpsG, partial [Salmonella enterica]|nr:phosphomannomutase CpsG [Salmonella enterica]